jgi:hypothetical protein
MVRSDPPGSLDPFRAVGGRHADVGEDDIGGVLIDGP